MDESLGIVSRSIELLGETDSLEGPPWAGQINFASRVKLNFVGVKLKILQ